MAIKENPFDKMSKARKDSQNQLVEQAKTTVKATENKGKRKVGRPVIDESKGKKRDYCKTINIAVPKDKLKLVNEYGLVARSLSLTDYINLLIEQDLEKNLENYKKEIKRIVNFD